MGMTTWCCTGRFRSLVCGVLLLTMAGCGQSGLTVIPVSGKVTYQGKPQNTGVIYFVPERGPLASAPLSQEGTFQLTTRQVGDGAVAGSHRVYFVPTELPAATTSGGMVGPRPPSPPFLPQKFCSPETSQLTAQVSTDTNQFDFELRD